MFNCSFLLILCPFTLLCTLITLKPPESTRNMNIKARVEQVKHLMFPFFDGFDGIWVDDLLVIGKTIQPIVA